MYKYYLCYSLQLANSLYEAIDGIYTYIMSIDIF